MSTAPDGELLLMSICYCRGGQKQAYRTYKCAESPNAFPRGEGAPVRTLGRMRNGEVLQIKMHFRKKVLSETFYLFISVQRESKDIAVPHPSRLRRSTSLYTREALSAVQFGKPLHPSLLFQCRMENAECRIVVSAARMILKYHIVHFALCILHSFVICVLRPNT